VPELPEVQALCADVATRAVGCTVVAVWPSSFSVLKTVIPGPEDLTGLEVAEVLRRGKFLCLRAGDLWLCTHLARAGWLRWTQARAPVRVGGPIALRVLLGPQDSAGGFDLTEAGTKKKLAVHIVRDPMEVPGIARLGPDPLELSTADLAGILQGRRTQLKGLLRDQAVIAGVGNAYSDEVLWSAQLSPFKQAGSLTGPEVQRLHGALLSTLHTAIERASGVPAAGLKSQKKAALAVHTRTGLPCPRCGDTVREVSFADSSLQYCPTCQTGGKPLADRRMSRLLR
jgi:formamidopyrimidine-DNA glycosylase